MIIARIFFCRRELVYRLRGGQRNSSQSTLGPWTNYTREPPFTCEIVYWVSSPSATSETGRAWRGSRCIIIIQRFYYSADMIYYSVNCLCAVTWVDETPVRNGAIWWNGIFLSCPISSLWASVCINMVAIHSLVDLFFFFVFLDFVHVYPRLLCVSALKHAFKIRRKIV